MKGLRILLPGIALVVMGFCWSFASPPGAAADGNFHLASIWCAWGDSDTCRHVTGSTEVEVPQYVAEAGCFAQMPTISGRCTILKTGDWVRTDKVNPSTGGYPPAFYAAMRFFVGPDINRSVLLMRMFNSALAGFLLIAALALAGPVLRRAAALAWAVAIIPTGIFFIASVNPSSWAIIGAGFYWIFLLAFTRSRSWKSSRAVLSAALAAFCAALAILSRSDSAFVLAVTTFAIIVLDWKRIRMRFNPLWLLLGLIPIVAIALFFRVGRYLAELSFVLPAGNADTDQPNPLVKTLLELPAFLAGILGGQQPSWTQRESLDDTHLAGYTLNGFSYGTGSLDTWNPSIAGILSVAACTGVIFLGLSMYSRRKLFALGILCSGLVVQVIVMRGLASFGSWENELGIQWVLQPRYFFAYVLVTVGLAALCHPATRRLLNPVQGTLVAGAMSIAATVALMSTIARYMHGQNHSWLQFELFDAWWWPHAPLPLTIICLGGLASAIYMFSLVWIADNPERPDLHTVDIRASQ